MYKNICKNLFPSKKYIIPEGNFIQYTYIRKISTSKGLYKRF